MESAKEEKKEKKDAATKNSSPLALKLTVLHAGVHAHVQTLALIRLDE